MKSFWAQIERPTKTVPKMAIKPIFKKNSIFLLCNPYWLQTKDKRNKDGIYEKSLIVKESIKIPNAKEAKAAFKGLFLSENGNNKITGQHGFIPFIVRKLGEIIIQAGKQIKDKKIKNFLLYLAIIL